MTLLKNTLTLFILLFSLQSLAQSKVYIKVGEANIKKSLLAMPAFRFFGSKTLNKKHLQIGKNLYSVAFNDLDVSSYFQFVRQSAFLEDTDKAALKPKSIDKKGFTFENWTPLGAEFLVKAGYSIKKNRIFFETYVYHITTAKLIFGKEYEAPIRSARKIAHTFANDMIEQLTGKKGMFRTRVVVSSDRASGKKQQKEIFVMDWDGHNFKDIRRHGSITISPAWSSDGQGVAYTVFPWPGSKRKDADLFYFDFKTGKSKVLSQRRGIDSGAAFIPGRKELLLTISKGGNPDIYRLDMQGKIREQLTFGPKGSMNVEPAISPDGKRVAFSSDRSGRPMIYVMNLKKPKKRARKATRIVFAGWYNASPSWSPDSRRLAFSGYDKTLKHFDIFLMNADGTDLIRLTTARKVNGKFSNNEAPTFSPDGRHVMFVSDHTQTKQLFIVNVDGSNERRITFDRFNYYKPKWSSSLE